MSWSTAFEELMPHTVQVAAFASVSTDGYLTPTFGSASTYSARWVQKQAVVKDQQGEEVLASTIVWVASTSTFAPTDKLTLPDGSTGNILNVEQLTDESGLHHVKVYLG